MTAYIIRRVLFIIPTMLGIMLVAFAAYHRSMSFVAGGLLGLAAAIKLSRRWAR